MRSYQQVVAVSNDKMNVLYIGMDNPLTIVVGDYPCSKIIAKTNIGKLTRYGDSCHYTFMTDSLCKGKGGVTIEVDILDSGKTKCMGTSRFRLKNIPDPVAFIANTNGGFIDKKILAAAQGIVPIMLDFDFDLYFTIKSYSFQILRKDSVIYEKTNISGGRLTDDIRYEVLKTSTDDKVIFFNINGVGPDNIVRILNEINFTIK